MGQEARTFLRKLVILDLSNTCEEDAPSDFPAEAAECAFGRTVHHRVFASSCVNFVEEKRHLSSTEEVHIGGCVLLALASARCL